MALTFSPIEGLADSGSYLTLVLTLCDPLPLCFFLYKGNPCSTQPSRLQVIKVTGGKLSCLSWLATQPGPTNSSLQMDAGLEISLLTGLFS